MAPSQPRNKQSTGVRDVRWRRRMNVFFPQQLVPVDPGSGEESERGSIPAARATNGLHKLP